MEPASRSPSKGAVTIPRQKLRELVQMLAYSVSILRNVIELDDNPQPSDDSVGASKRWSIAIPQPDEVIDAPESAAAEAGDADENGDDIDDSECVGRLGTRCRFA